MNSFLKGVTVGIAGTIAGVYTIGALTDREIKNILDADEQFHIDLGMNRVADNIKNKFKNMIK